MTKDILILAGTTAVIFGTVIACDQYNKNKDRALQEKKAENERLYFSKLTPEQVENLEKEKLEVTFVHPDGSVEVKYLYLGDTLFDQPTPKDKVGYNVEKDYWYKEPECNRTATFYDITENVTFYAKATPKTYTITFDPNGGALENNTMTITYDANYTLPTPTHYDDRDFNGWTYNGKKVDLSGIWNLDVDGKEITLIAQWGASGWTGSY